MKSKTSENSKTIHTDSVLPADANSLNGLFGGELLARMGIMHLKKKIF